jgi:hypothetical protein
MAQMPQGNANQKPSIVGVANFDPNADAKVLRNAMKGANTDEKAIIKILTTRTNAQVQAIRQAYAKAYSDKDLIKTIKDETSGNFEKTCVYLLLPRSDFDAQNLHDAMSGMGTNESVLLEILCTRTSAEVDQIIKAYDRLYDKSLESVVKSETKGDIEKFLVSILSCKRPPSGKIDENAAKKDAETLYKAGEGKMGTDEAKFVDILTTRSFSQIAQIAFQYEKVSKKTLLNAIDSEMNGDIQKACQTVVGYAKDPAAYWADRLKDTMKGMGTDEKKLIRICVSRAEIDLKSIRDIFGDRYGKGKTLIEWVKSDLSGDFENVIVGLLLGNEQK